MEIKETRTMNAEMINFAWFAKRCGYSTQAIADALHVSTKTIKFAFRLNDMGTGKANTILPPLIYHGKYKE